MSSWPGLLLALTACLSLTGCLNFLKPAKVTARHFVLTSLPPADGATTNPGALAVGVGGVKLPDYLFDTSLAIRKGTNEIDYLPEVIWAERLDNGIQRVLAANLATLLPTDQIRLSAWRREDVGVEVYVSIEHFETDTSGRGLLAARWRVVAPGGENTLKAGESRFTRSGPSPEVDPSGAVATLSELVAELSREMVAVMNSAGSRR